VICWSCEKDAGTGVLCGSCGALQPPDAAADHFAVLGVARRYELDVGELEARYKDLSRKVHPDRFARADPRARRASLQRTVQLNEAWRTLKDPVRRAEYLLELAGGRKMASAGSVGSEDDRAVPPALLMEALERREELADARMAGDHARVRRLGEATRARVADAMKAIAAGFEAGRLDDVARALVALRYERRFLDEVAVHEESREEAAHGG
jgi:molecular chaperone HscB